MVAFAPDCSSEVNASLHNPKVPKVPSSSPGPNFFSFFFPADISTVRLLMLIN